MQQSELEWGAGNRGPRARRDVLRGDVTFASTEQQSQRCTELLGAGALLVTLPAPTADARGRLGELLEELVERELARMGAPSPYLSAWSAMPEDAQARLADQLFRARTVGASGLAIAMGSLRAIALPELDPDDSATLRWLAETTEEASLVLLVDDADLMVLGYAAPMPLGALLARRRPSWEPDAGLHVVVEAEDEPDAAHFSAPLVDAGSAEIQVTVDVASYGEDASSALANEGDPAAGIHVTVDVASSAVGASDAREERDVELRGDDATTNETCVASIDAGRAVLEAAAFPPRVPGEPIAPSVEDPAPETEASGTAALGAPVEVSPEPTPRPRERRPSRRSTAGIPVSGPNDAWRTWAITLSGARGAQPLAVFERLFMECYVPLANAITAGLDDTRALRAYDEFRRSFERSYTDAFATFGATNRRPRLVMDAYDLASKQARLAGARAAHVLVVDSMRFDLGCLVRDALAREATGIATLTSELLLWSALPTTTSRQVETFARGLDALRDPVREEPSESLRGRAAEVVRRIRLGSRELYKLDLVPAMLEGTTDVVGSLHHIANATAEALARHVSTLAPRTLLYIIGDHGFAVDRRGQIQTGGASPEEVLVPACSWLIGDAQ